MQTEHKIMNDTTQEATQDATEPANNTKAVTFNFRVLKADHKDFADTEKEYAEKEIPFTTQTGKDAEGNDVVIGLKRDSVTYELPVLDPSSFSEGFVASLIMDQVSAVVKKEFVDNCLVPDNAMLTAAYIEEALEAKRTSAIDPEAVEALAVLTGEFLSANGIPDSTVKIVKELVAGKFVKRVLNGYATLEAQFEGVLANVAKAISAQEDEFQAILLPVHAQLETNLARYRKEQEANKTPLELALL